MPANRPPQRTSIPLERQFVAVSEPLASGDVSVELLRWAGKVLTWGDVLAKRCAVIFGEAGTGKTAEFRSRTSALLAAGSTAFFLPIEAVAQRGVAASLDLKTSAGFKQWCLDPTVDGWFLLDSVDEAKLKGQLLTAVLRTLARELGATALARSHVLLSSRPSDWRSTDEEALEELATCLVSAGTQAERPVLLQILPLDQSQVRALAAHFGVTELDAFLGAVRTSNAWSFLQRPQDVKWLARYWIANGRLGSYRELVSHNVEERLSERHDRPSVLSANDARDAAGKLALASLLTRSGAFLLPGESDPRAADALEPAKLLPGQSAAEIADLLGRGLFDEATYGRVRIHHRTVTDFLASEQIDRMRAGSLAQSDIEALLFRSIAGRTVIPANLTGVTAWLALGSDAIRRRIIECAPEILLDEGDPSGLSAADRRTTLRAYAQHFADRGRVFHHLDPFGLQRFASPELSDTIRELLSNASESNHLRTTLLRMIEEGRIRNLVGDVLVCALASTTDHSVRRSAIRAVAAAGLESDRARLVPLLRTSAARDAEVLAALLKVLFPTYISGRDVAEALVAAVRPPNTVTSLDVYATELAKSCDRLQCADLLAAFVAVLRPPSGTHEDSLNPHHVWLSEYVAELAARVVDDGPPFPPALAGALTLLREVRGIPGSVSSDRVERLLDATPHLRREAFWSAVATRADKARYPRTAFALQFGHLSTRDAVWLRADCVERPSVRERLLAFDCLAQSLPETQSYEAKVALLEAVSRESSAKHRDDALATRLRRMLAPPWVEPHPGMLRIARLHRVRDRQQERLHEKHRVAISAALPSIRAGHHAQALLHFYQRCGSRDSGSRHDALSVDKVRTLYGGEAAQAAVEGFRRYWKLAELPALEDMLPNSTPLSIILGLVGVTLDVEAGEDLAALSDDLLVRVTTLASRELNGFPDWFVGVAERRPDLVREVLSASLRRDYDAVADPKQPALGLVMWKLPSAPLEVRRACAPLLREWLLVRDPASTETLSFALDVLTSTASLTTGELAALARERVGLREHDAVRFGIWWCAWLGCDPSAAISFLRLALFNVDNTQPLMEEVCSRLWTQHDVRSPTNSSPLRADRSALAALASLVHAYIRERDDVEHDQVYSPGPRDHAQELRDSLLGWLADVPGEETVVALDGLANDASFSEKRDWLRHLADRRATLDAAATAMTSSEVVELFRTGTVQPRTTADLFLLAQNRLDEICDNVAHGDFSVRDIYNPKDAPVLEEHVQNYLAQELEHRRRNQYAVSREPEVTRKKKPDIRLIHSSCDGPITLEVKIAERWSTAQLEDALRSQLVGTYMQPNNSRFGVFLVCSSGPTKKWEVGGKDVSFRDLVAHLRAQAKAIAEVDEHVDGLAVVACDFH